MATLASISEVINRLTGGNSGAPDDYGWWKDTSGLTFTAATHMSMWNVPGQPGAGAIPTTAAVCTNLTAGALRHTNATGGRQRWLRSAWAQSWTGCQVIIYDRLLHCGGLSGTVTTAQTVGTDVTRYAGANSVGNLILAEVYTLIGSTARVVSCNYLDKDAVSRASGSVVFGGANARQPGHCVIVPYNTTAGANSVTRVVDATISATTGTAGNWGITIARPLLELSIPAVDVGGFGAGTRRLVLENIEQITDACLGVLLVTNTSVLTNARGGIISVER